MGMPRQIARLLLHEHRHRPIAGDILMLGRQTVYLAPPAAVQLVKDVLGAVRPGAEPEVDPFTTIGKERGTVSDRGFFGLFSEGKVVALDVSDYEGAEIVHDMTAPLPAALEGRFDFIYNGSCLDNMFDPALALKNMSRLLRPGGRVVHLEHGSLWPGAYLMYSMDWFYDYYVINDWADCKAYLALWDDVQGPWDLYGWQPVMQVKDHGVFYGESLVTTPRHAYAIVLAEKGEASTWEKAPLQSKYRPPAVRNDYFAGAKRFLLSPRKYVHTGTVTPPALPNAVFCGSLP